MIELSAQKAANDKNVEAGELQNMIQSVDKAEDKKFGEVCLISESPFRILRVCFV